MAAGLSIGRIYLAVIVLLIIAYIMVGYLFRYGDPLMAQTYNNTYINGSSAFQSKVYNPLVNQTSNSLNLSNNLPQSSQQAGFSFAFILTGFGSVITSIVQSPKIILTFLNIMIGNLGLVAGVNNALTQLISISITEVFLGFSFILAASSWQKFPLWT